MARRRPDIDPQPAKTQTEAGSDRTQTRPNPVCIWTLRDPSSGGVRAEVQHESASRWFAGGNHRALREGM